MCTNKDCFEDACTGDCTKQKKKKETNKEDWPWYRYDPKHKD